MRLTPALSMDAELELESARGLTGGSAEFVYAL
jgi:hypothetical protein